MQPINLYIIDISSSKSISGVDRHIEELLEGLKAYPFIHVHWIQLLHDKTLIMYREEIMSNIQKRPFLSHKTIRK